MRQKLTLFDEDIAVKEIRKAQLKETRTGTKLTLKDMHAVARDRDMRWMIFRFLLCWSIVGALMIASELLSESLNELILQGVAYAVILGGTGIIYYLGGKRWERHGQRLYDTYQKLYWTGVSGKEQS